MSLSSGSHGNSTNLCVLLWLQLALEMCHRPCSSFFCENEQRALFSLRRWCIHRGHSAAYEEQKDEQAIFLITMKLITLILLLLLTATAIHAHYSRTGSSQSEEDFQVYGQSVISLDGTVEKSLAAVIRVPREQPTNEMPNDEPDTSPPSSGRPIYDPSIFHCFLYSLIFSSIWKVSFYRRRF